MENINDKYGLPRRVKLENLGDNTIGIVKIIKSRIIQKDAKKIIEISNLIKEVDNSIDVVLVCTENICSKSKKVLSDNNIDLVFRTALT